MKSIEDLAIQQARLWLVRLCELPEYWAQQSENQIKGWIILFYPGGWNTFYDETLGDVVA